MYFIGIILVILVVSFLLSLYTLRGELKKSKKIMEIKEELSKGKVLFQASSSDKSLS